MGFICTTLDYHKYQEKKSSCHFSLIFSNKREETSGPQVKSLIYLTMNILSKYQDLMTIINSLCKHVKHMDELMYIFLIDSSRTVKAKLKAKQMSSLNT